METGVRGMNVLWALSPVTTVLLVILGVGVLVVLAIAAFVAGTYNTLVTLRNRYKNAYSQIDVQLKRRYDLIPNLVEAVKGYMSHEKGTLEAVIQARSAAVTASKAAAANPGDPAAMSSLAAAEGALRGSLGRLFALSEAYPDLKANQNMLSLQGELTSTENQVSSSRLTYNDAVMQYNTQRETFPTIVVANFLNFSEAKLFELDSDKEREAPRVSFS
jgi:LemA protein